MRHWNASETQKLCSKMVFVVIISIWLNLRRLWALNIILFKYIDLKLRFYVYNVNFVSIKRLMLSKVLKVKKKYRIPEESLKWIYKKALFNTKTKGGMVVVLRVTVDFSITQDCELVGHHKKKRNMKLRIRDEMHP